MNTPTDESIRFSQVLGVFLARFCPSAWLGAASLFVVVGVREVTRGGFDSVTKDALVSLRFPSYYAFGASLIGLGWIGAWLAGQSPQFTPARRTALLALLASVLCLMAADYVCVYQPLLQMVTPPGQQKPASFVKYHETSKWLNLAGLLICFSAALIANWPSKMNHFDSSNERH